MHTYFWLIVVDYWLQCTEWITRRKSTAYAG